MYILQHYINILLEILNQNTTYALSCTFQIQLKLLRKRAFLTLVKQCLLVCFLVWIFFISTHLLPFYKETHNVSSYRQKTFIFNMPVLQKSDYNTRERQQYIRPYVFSDNINSTIDRSLHISRPGTIAVKSEIKTPEAVNTRLASKSSSMNTGITFEKNDSNLPHEYQPRQSFNLKLDTENPYCFFKDDFVIKDPFLNAWSQKTILCDGQFHGFANIFVRWNNITIDASKSRGAYGGEDVTNVLKQRESNELLNPRKGFFQAECRFRPKYTFLKYFSSKGNLPTWLKMVTFSRQRRRNPEVISNFTILIQRNEYANVYHSMNDIFNVFLLHIFFHKNPKDSVIIFADGHPKGHIDPLWKKLFGQVRRVRHLEKPTKFKDMVWPMMEKFSPLNLFDLKQVSYIDHFRTFVFGNYGIVPRSSPNCNDINILFLWRHNYLAHPRNPRGKLMRKIKNEDELLNHTRLAFPTITFRAVDLAPLAIEEQLHLISKTDIIVAMHGAGLMLELFLPPRGGVIELLPLKLKNFTKRQFDLFKVITDRIPLHYLRWQNKYKSNEVSDGYTYIPPDIVKGLVSQMVSKVCKQT